MDSQQRNITSCVYGSGPDAQEVSVECVGNRTVITFPNNMTIVATGSVTLTSGSRNSTWRLDGGRPGPRGPLHGNGTVHFPSNYGTKQRRQQHQRFLKGRRAKRAPGTVVDADEPDSAQVDSAGVEEPAMDTHSPDFAQVTVTSPNDTATYDDDSDYDVVTVGRPPSLSLSISPTLCAARIVDKGWHDEAQEELSEVDWTDLPEGGPGRLNTGPVVPSATSRDSSSREFIDLRDESPESTDPIDLAEDSKCTGKPSAKDANSTRRLLTGK